jgi:hypothetical protein
MKRLLVIEGYDNLTRDEKNFIKKVLKDNNKKVIERNLIVRKIREGKYTRLKLYGYDNILRYELMLNFNKDHPNYVGNFPLFLNKIFRVIDTMPIRQQEIDRDLRLGYSSHDVDYNIVKLR